MAAKAARQIASIILNNRIRWVTIKPIGSQRAGLLEAVGVAGHLTVVAMPAQLPPVAPSRSVD
jgi:hypothetical protein